MNLFRVRLHIVTIYYILVPEDKILNGLHECLLKLQFWIQLTSAQSTFKQGILR